jgi:flagellar hook assembly protein FlgD
VKSETLEPMQAGRREWSWDGRDQSNQALGSGIYYVQLRAGNTVDRLRIALVK